MNDDAVRPSIYLAPRPVRVAVVVLMAAALTCLMVLVALTAPLRAFAAEATVDLGASGTYSVLAGSTATNTGPSVLSGDLGVSPGDSATGFGPPATVGGQTHLADTEALAAQSALTTAYNDAAGRASSATITADLGNQNLVAGVYQASSSAGLTGQLTLDGADNPNSVFIFQIGSTLTTAPDSSVILTNGAQACNVFWQVGSSATLDTGTSFIGTILALTSISVNSGATIQGRALARNGQVSLIDDTFTSSACLVPSASPSASPSPSESPSASDSASPSDSGSPSESPSVSDSASASDSASPSTSPSVSDSASATESPIQTATQSEIESPSASVSGISTQSEIENSDTATATATTGAGSGSGGSGGNLASTGSSASTTWAAVGGALLVLAGGTILLWSRVTPRTRGRHKL